MSYSTECFTCFTAEVVVACDHFRNQQSTANQSNDLTHLNDVQDTDENPDVTNSNQEEQAPSNAEDNTETNVEDSDAQLSDADNSEIQGSCKTDEDKNEVVKENSK